MKHHNAKLKSSWTTVNGLPMYARVSAEPSIQTSAAIVMVHGLVVSGRYMLPTAEQLAAHCRVYVPDLPGYGKSGKPKHVLTIIELSDALAAWMDAIGLAKATLLGNSMGCQIIANFALRHPERIERAILVAPTMDPKACTPHHSIGRWLLNIPGEPLSLFPIVMLDYFQIGLRRFIYAFRYALQDHIEEQLPYMHIPTLVVHGSRDPVVPLRCAQEAAELLPNARLVTITGAAHDINYNSPTQLAQAVLQFVSETAVYS
ncbi:MAG: alpha/beta hydrolase [Ktedonobacteraceae bacterium]